MTSLSARKLLAPLLLHRTTSFENVFFQSSPIDVATVYQSVKEETSPQHFMKIFPRKLTLLSVEFHQGSAWSLSAFGYPSRITKVQDIGRDTYWDTA